MGKPRGRHERERVSQSVLWRTCRLRSFGKSIRSLRVSRTRDLTFDAVRIVEIYTPAFASGREAGSFESRDRISGIVIGDAVAVMIQPRLLALEQCQPRSEE